MSRRALAVGLLALLFLHGLTAALRYPWEAPAAFGDWQRLSPDFVGLLALGTALALLCGTRAWIAHLLTVGFLLVPLYRFGATIMPAFYGKGLDLYNDVLLVPGLTHLLLHRLPPPLQFLAWLLAVLAACALYLALFAVVRAALVPLGHRRIGPWILLAGQLFALALLVEHSYAPERRSRVGSPSQLARFFGDLVRIGPQWREKVRFADTLARTEELQRHLPSDLGRLAGADVYFLFIESYGRVVQRDPESRAAFEAWSEAWLDDLNGAGFEVLSTFAFPSVKGGSSSFAHAEFTAGIGVRTRRTFELMLASELEPLAKRFRAAGYRTLNVQPATTGEWPEGRRFFGYEEDVFASAFPYEGHAYHWGAMPDQFALAHLLKNVLPADERPRFVQYVSVTSHAPFSMVPPLYEDWERATEPGAFAEEPARSFPIHWLNYAGHPDLEAAYLAVIRYSLECGVRFALHLERPSLVFLIGDHQPPNVGDLQRSDASFDVPIHVLANEPELLRPFYEVSFQPGFLPDPAVEAFPAHLFLEYFLRQTSTAGR